MKNRVYFFLAGIIFLIFPTYGIAQIDLPPAVEGGNGFVNSQTAYNFGKGYLGIKFVGIYSNKKLFDQSEREHLFIEATSFTYDFSDEAEFSAMLYSIARGLTGPNSTKTSSGLGKSILGFKYEFPLNSDNFNMGIRTSFHIPMGGNFMIHPSFPYDSQVYSVELTGLQSFGLIDGFRVHLNEGYRWQGLRKEFINKEDLIISSITFDYDFGKNWFGYSELTSWVENDNLIEPLKDRLIFTQGLRYVTPWNLGLNLSGNFRLSEKRTDGTPARAEKWRVLFGFSISTRTYKPDRDKDGIPDLKDIEPDTPAGFPVGANGKALDSDNDGVPDGIDLEAQTLKGAKVDKFGRSLDSDGDGIVDGLDQEPNTPKGAKVDSKGIAIDTDNDGIPDGIDQEPNTLKGAKVDSRGIAIDADGDGVPDGIDQEPNTPKGALINSKGEAIDSDGDGVPDGIDKEQNSPTGIPVDKDGVSLKSEMEIALLTKGLIRVQKIYFDIGKLSIKPESYSVLSEIGRI